MLPGNTKSFFSHERIRGFVYAFAAFGALEVARLLVVFGDAWYAAVFPSLFGAVIFFVAFFALNNQQYRRYAQGALLGWLAFGITSLGLKILFSTL